jgi:hypothetical protein
LDNRLKAGDWLMLDDWGCLARLDSINYSDPTTAHLQIFDEEGDTFVFQDIRLKDHKIIKITKEVADIMRGV